MVNVLVVGATRGLGRALAEKYASSSESTVYGTARSTVSSIVQSTHGQMHWVPKIDLMQPGVGAALVNSLGMLGVGDGSVGGRTAGFDVVYITAGYFGTEDFESGPRWEDEVRMYTTSSIAPPCIVHALYKAKMLAPGCKIILVSSESGSITLRHPSEGGGNYGHHASKAAVNMVGKLLSMDLRDKGVIVSIVHPGFMRTEMTKGIGFDKFWDDGGAVTPDVAADSLVQWVIDLDMSKTGQYWAPRGPGDIGTAGEVMGNDLATPLHLPW